MAYGIINSIDDELFVHPNGLAFDFRSKADITFIEFLGNIPKKIFNGEQRLSFWKRQIKKDVKIDVNVLIIADIREKELYSVNFTGVEGVCNTIWELSKIILDKLYLKGTTKKTIVFADCGGTIPAILSSTIVPYHSLNLTTPYLTVIGPDNEFDTGQYSLWHAREISIHVFNTKQDFKSHYDTLQYCEEFTKNPNQLLNLHWATNIVGTDLLFRHKANLLPKRPNLAITDHIVPPHFEGHLLASYLFRLRKYQKMVAEQIDIQKKILDNNILS